jgi:hypothetical protein
VFVPGPPSGARTHYAVGIVLALLATPGCRDKGNGPPTLNDGGMDVSDPAARALTIAVTGCAELDFATVTCRGAPPLTLSFAPVGAPEVDEFVWTFGDGSLPVIERAPTHTYPRRGEFMVHLVGGGPSGEFNADPVRVEVAALPPGAPCDVAEQCTDGRCICGAGAGCSPAFIRGLCTTSCDRGSCGVGSTCVALALESHATNADAGPPEPVCLADCRRDGDCNAGLVCVGAPAGGNTAGSRWTAACLPAGAYKRIGDSCRGPDGSLVHDACATGHCADLGALGVCSASCADDLPCPLGASCVRLRDGRQLCLETCANASDCGLDPLLACAPVAPGGDAGAAAPVCSPKVCASEADCAPAGRCAADALCTRR